MFIKYSKCRLSMFYIRRRAGFETGSRVLDNSKHADKRVNDGTILRDKPLVLVYVVISIEETWPIRDDASTSSVGSLPQTLLRSYT